MPKMSRKVQVEIPPAPDMTAEAAAYAAGYKHVCGIDEAGRGPLAGPVVAAAVVLPTGYDIPGLNDSKKLTAKKRDALYEQLMADELNILRATHLAMARAAQGITPAVDFCLIDGLAVPNFPLPSQNMVKGDARCLSIAAASVLAKVTRDRYMQRLAEEFPQYGFDRHAGYGTKAHLEAIRKYGVTIHHRRTFAPVAQMELPLGL